MNRDQWVSKHGRMMCDMAGAHPDNYPTFANVAAQWYDKMGTERYTAGDADGFRRGVEAAAKYIEDRYCLLKYRAEELREVLLDNK